MRRIFLLCMVMVIVPVFVLKYIKSIMPRELNAQKSTTAERITPSIFGNLNTVAYMDIIHLKSGQKIEGRITGYVDDVLLIEPVSGKGLMCPRADNKEIEKDALVWVKKKSPDLTQEDTAWNKDMSEQLALPEEEKQDAGDEKLQLSEETELANELKGIMKRIPRFFERHAREIEELNEMIGQGKK